MAGRGTAIQYNPGSHSLPPACGHPHSGGSIKVSHVPMPFHRQEVRRNHIRLPIPANKISEEDLTRTPPQFETVRNTSDVRVIVSEYLATSGTSM